jgi:hypothetical protein
MVLRLELGAGACELALAGGDVGGGARERAGQLLQHFRTRRRLGVLERVLLEIGRRAFAARLAVGVAVHLDGVAPLGDDLLGGVVPGRRIILRARDGAPQRIHLLGALGRDRGHRLVGLLLGLVDFLRQAHGDVLGALARGFHAAMARAIARIGIVPVRPASHRENADQNRDHEQQQRFQLLERLERTGRDRGQDVVGHRRVEIGARQRIAIVRDVEGEQQQQGAARRERRHGPEPVHRTSSVGPAIIEVAPRPRADQRAGQHHQHRNHQGGRPALHQPAGARLADHPAIGGDLHHKQERQPEHLAPEHVVIVRLGLGQLMLDAEGAVVAIGAREIGVRVVELETDRALRPRLLGAERRQHRLRLARERLEILRQRREILARAHPQHLVRTLVERAIDAGDDHGLGGAQLALAGRGNALAPVGCATLAELQLGGELLCAEVWNGGPPLASPPDRSRNRG